MESREAPQPNWFRNGLDSLRIRYACFMNEMEGERARVRASRQPSALEKWLDLRMERLMDRIMSNTFMAQVENAMSNAYCHKTRIV